MTGVAIEFDNISKSYGKTDHRLHRQFFFNGVPAKQAGLHTADDTVWALRDVSFKIKNGETVGFVGSNGAGKSTLLKILARITKPTAGKGTVNGRVGSLLEVGTGFHPELTGYENIYLNGSILGMKRAEISRKFEEIVEFSGVGDILSRPVKQYSSGEYMRLGFSVAAHLDSEILILDEVLAVGDGAFQDQCQQKILSLATEGRTVLFVSHNMDQVENVCDKVIWLDHGSLVDFGPTTEIIQKYESSFASLQLN